MEIQAALQPGKLFVFQNIYSFYFFLHDLHDHGNRVVQNSHGLG